MTSPLPPFPATMWAGWERPKRWGKSPASGPTQVKVDAATWLAGLTPAEAENVLFWREAYLPRLGTEPVWADPSFASLRPAWEVTQAQSKAYGDPADVPVTLDLSDGRVVKWLHRNVFATFLQSASLYLHAYKELAPVTVGRVVADVDGGKDMKTLILKNIDDDRVITREFDLIAAALTGLVRFFAATNPEMEVDLVPYLVPYLVPHLVGPTPRDQWMKADRALAYREAGVTSGEARAWDFGAATNRPTDETLATLAGLHGTSR